MRSLLILGKGDTDYTDRNVKGVFAYAQEAGFDVQRMDYGELRNTAGASAFRHQTIHVHFFFPYTFWNAHCEVPEDTKLYGTSGRSYELFQQFFLDVQRELGEKYGNDHQMKYTIQPAFAALDRDKRATLELLRSFGIETSDVIYSRNAGEVIDHITPDRGVFIKCRYGAEGKGITLLQREKWLTNYKVENDRLDNYDTYGRWQFTDITGKRALLEQLLEHEVVVEREVVAPRLFEGKKFDTRAYVVNGRIPHFFVRVNALEKVVTNFSQGADVLHHPMTGLPAEYIGQIRREAIKAAQAFQSHFLGVDIMFDGSAETPRVIEVQTFADFSAPDKFNLAKYMVSAECGLFWPEKENNLKNKDE